MSENIVSGNSDFTDLTHQPEQRLVLYCHSCNDEIVNIAVPSFIEYYIVGILATRLATIHHLHTNNNHNLSVNFGSTEIDRFGESAFINFLTDKLN